MTMRKNPKGRTENIVIQHLHEETLIYDLKENKAYCLNETSALVWQLCDGRKSISDISDEMSKKLKTLINEDFVNLALDQLNREGLLEKGGDMDDHFAGLSRREVIRKAGFASVIVLPVVSSLVAPQASMAQSCIAGVNVPCSTTSPPSCCTGNCLQLGFPASCCVGGATNNRPGGVTQGCLPNAFASQVNCDAGAADGCCSGTGTLAMTAGTNGCSGATTACVCNP